MAAFLLFGPQEHRETSSGPNEALESYPIPDERPVFNLHNISNSILGASALRKALETVNQMELQLISISSRAPDRSIICRELLPVLQDVGIMLALCQESSFNSNLVNTADLLALSTHLLASSESAQVGFGASEVLTATTAVIGGLVSSHHGIKELCLAFEDIWLEKAWFECMLDDTIHDYQLVGELRRRPGVLSLIEEIKSTACEMQITSPLALSKSDLAVITATLLDTWRTSDSILQLQLGDLSHIRRNSDVVSRACLNLARLCAYTCGREVRLFIFPSLH